MNAILLGLLIKGGLQSRRSLAGLSNVTLRGFANNLSNGSDDEED